MSIYLDISAAVHHRAGLGRYAQNLAQAMQARIPDQLAMFYNREQGIAPLPELKSLPTRTVALGYKPWRMLIWMGQLSQVPFNRLIPGAQLFHATEHLLMPLKDIPTILTVHDLIFQHLPEHHKFLNRWYLNLTMPLYCRRATHLIAVSEATRQDLITTYKLPPEKVTVIYEAADPQFCPQPQTKVEAVRAHYGLPQQFLLYVGTIEPRKNLIRLLQAWEILYLEGKAPPLVIVGKRGWLSDNFFAALENSPVRDAVILTGYVSDEDLPALYAAATVFIFPSLYEGFGLPPLEAMACGVPVACSNTASLPEVVGDAAMLFNPTATEEIIQVLSKLLNNTDLREALKKRGFERAAQFSWDRTARETLELYQKISK